MSQNTLEIEIEDKEKNQRTQKGDIDAIFERIDNAPPQHHLFNCLLEAENSSVF
jgi:hypothetical protein